MHDLVVFLLDTGCRASEAGRLTWADVDLDHGTVRLWRTKNKRNRAVPLPERAAAMLARRASLRLGAVSPTDRVFPGWMVVVPGGEERSDPMTRAFSSLMDELGMGTDPEATLHALRHTYASRLVQAGVSLQVVQQLLGHSSIQVTMRYAHLAPANLREAVATLNRVTAHRTKSDAATA